MELRVQFLSNCLIVCSLLWLLSCFQKTEQFSYYVEDSLHLESRRGVLYLDNGPFSGRLFTLFPGTKDTASIKSYQDGRASGIWKAFYPNGELKEIRAFAQGKKEGLMKSYWENGQIQKEYRFKNDEYEGLCKEWSPTGILTLEMHYHLGHEEGQQKLRFENGKIRSNYIIKKGRRYGLLGTKNCVNVSDSVFNSSF